MRKVRPDLLDSWARERAPGSPWHLAEAIQAGIIEAACGVLLHNAKDRQRWLRGHWPEGACGGCCEVMRATTTRVKYADAKRGALTPAEQALIETLP